MSTKITRYGATWTDMDDLAIEMKAIQFGGTWISRSTGKECGAGLFWHYRRMQQLLWPEEDDTRWSDLILSEILSNTITVLSGPGDTGKTHGMTKFALVDYWCFPQETLIIMSSTDIRSLEGRIWGDCKSMFAKARDKFPNLAGHVIDSKHCICTDDLDDEEVESRDLRKGILCIPCKRSGGTDNSVASYVGMKQKRRRYFSDETQFMSGAMFESIANTNMGDFVMVAAGNPIGQGDPLDLMSEPECGWDAIGEVTKTTVWKNKLFKNSKTVVLIGTDSPNFDPPYQPGDKPRYKYLIHQDKIDRIVAGGWGKDSAKYWSQVVGMRRTGLLAKRVLTREILEQGGAYKPAIWSGKTTKKVFGLDAAYGGVGGDRCVACHCEFGESVDSIVTIGFYPMQIVPVSVKKPDPPEDQIAQFVKYYCQTHAIPPGAVFFDSTGRGTLGTSLARIWSADCQPIEFGGKPTKRPVSADTYIVDPSTGRRKLQICLDHYSKFVTELWFSVRYAVQSGQIRDFPKDAAQEFCQREWIEVNNARIEIEPKSEMRERTGRSPDYADTIAVMVEGCRRLGFVISRMGGDPAAIEDGVSWLKKLRSEREDMDKKYALTEA